MLRTKKKVIPLLIIVMILIIIYSSLIILSKTYASYELNGEISVSNEKALYIFKEGKLSFNIDLEKIIPSVDPYEYTFTLSNYDSSKRSDVDIEYNITVITTTNLPLNYELIYDGNNILDEPIYSVDEDESWYKVMNTLLSDTFLYSQNQTRTYKLKVYFPIEYSNTAGYEGIHDNIEIIINSKQIIE